MAVARVGHLPGGGPRPAVGVVQLGGAVVADHEDLAVAQQRGRASSPPLTILPVAVQVPLAGSYTSAPRPGCRIRVVDIPNEHPAVAQQRGREAIAGSEHVPGGRPGPGVRVVQLRGGVGLVRPAPPATSTRPSRSRTAVWPERGVPIVPVAIQPPAGGLARNAGGGETPAGMYNSSGPRYLPRGPCHQAATWPSYRRHRRSDHVPGGRPGPAVGVVQLCAVDIPHEDLAVGQHGGREASVGLEHASSGGPGAAGRVVQLRGRVVLIVVGATHDEHPAIEQWHHEVFKARRSHRASGGPGASGRIV